MSHFSVLSATLLSSKKLEQATVQKYWYIQYVFFKGMYSITLKVVLLTKYKSIIISNFPQFFFHILLHSLSCCALYLFPMEHLWTTKYLFFLWQSFCPLALSTKVVEMLYRPSCEAAWDLLMWHCGLTVTLNAGMENSTVPLPACYLEEQSHLCKPGILPGMQPADPSMEPLPPRGGYTGVSSIAGVL